MLNIKIRRVKTEDIMPLTDFFKIVLTDTFHREGIGNKTKDLENEIVTKNSYVRCDLESDGKNRYFLLAIHEDTIIGTIEYGAASELIRNNTVYQINGLIEVGTLFVHPKYQGLGVGNVLLTRMYRSLQEKGIEEFYLDSGYKKAQKIWLKKFGDPESIVMNLWGEGFHHMIWRLKVQDLV